MYVDGHPANSEPVWVASMVDATGGFRIGRARVGGAFGEYFAGAVDDVRVYSGALSAATIGLLAAGGVERPEL